MIQQRPQNIFGLSNPYKLSDGNMEQLSTIKGHLESVGCSDPNQLSKVMAQDIELQSPASQTMMDVYSQSKYPSFGEFVNNTSLCHLRQDNIDRFTLFQQYQYYYNKDICSPLTQYLSSKQQSFEGNPNKILVQLLETINHCKNRANRMPYNCAQQMDIFFNLQSSQENDRLNEEQKEEQRANDNVDVDDEEQAEESDDDDDNEDDYEARLNEYERNAELNNNNGSKLATTNIDFKEFPLSDNGIDHIMRQEFKTITTFEKFEPFSYSRHEVVFDEDSMHTLTAKDKIPQQLSPEITPLFRHYHTVNTMNAMAMAAANLLCFSVHILQSTIQLFCYIYANGRTYGQRVFPKDLNKIIASLYPNTKIITPTLEISKMETNEDIEINHTNVIFEEDPMYEEYRVVLYKRNMNTLSFVESILNEQQSTDCTQSNKLIEIDRNVERNTKLISETDEESIFDELKYESKISPYQRIKIEVSDQLIDECNDMVIEDFCRADMCYYYIDMSTSLQINDGEMHVIPCNHQQQKEISIINYDLHLKDTENECLYGIVVKDSNFSWTLVAFMTAEQIVEIYKINPNELPKSSRQSQAFKRKMIKLMMTENVIEETNWCNVQHIGGFQAALDAQSNPNALKICHHKFIQQCKKSFQDPDLPQFRILVQDGNNHWIEWIKVIRVEYSSSFSFYTAIQYGYDQDERSMVLEWINNELSKELPHELQIMVIEYCITIEIKAIHDDPMHIFALNQAVGFEQSIYRLSIEQISCLSPWRTQFEIADFESDLKTTVEVLNAENRQYVDISIIKERVIEQKIQFNYSYFLCNKFRVFRQIFPEISHGRLKRIYNALRPERETKDADETEVNFKMNWNVEPYIQYHGQIGGYICNWNICK